MAPIPRSLPLYVLVSTIGDGICRVPLMLQPPAPGVTYVVSWQQGRGDGPPRPGTSPAKAADLLARRRDVVLTTLHGSGLCRNRNHAIDTALRLLPDPRADAVFLLADDDERFLQGALARVRDIYLRNRRMSAALFRAADLHTGAPLKPYPQRPVRLGSHPRRYYPSSVELTFRAALCRAGLRFDERFGLGSPRLAAGEEDVFLADARAAGHTVWVLPLTICATPAATTGRRPLDVKILRSKGAVYGRLLPPARAYLRALREALSLALRHRRSPWPLLRNICHGIRYIRS